MFFLNPIPYTHYKPCRLTEGKAWFISYYVVNPATGKLKRIRVKINRIPSLRERRRVARQMMAAIDQRLSLGWNPLVNEKAPKAFTKLSDVLDTFLTVKERESEPNTMRSYISFVKTFRGWLASNGFGSDSFASSVTREAAMSFMNDVEVQVSPKTYNNYIGFYKSLFSWMMEKGYCEANPFAEIAKKSKRLIKKKRRLFTDEELGQLFAFLHKEGPEYLAMVLICYGCFIRPKEIVLLRCADIDLGRQLIHVNADIAKNDNDSYRTIPDDVIPVLRCLDLSCGDLYLFGKGARGEDFKPSAVKLCSRRIAQWWNLHVRPALGFGQDLQFYSLKDTGITNMLSDGVPINLVQQQADHSSVAMTAIYVGHKAHATEELRKFKANE